MSKGSNTRPKYISDETFNTNWDKIFTKVTKKKTKVRETRR